MHIGYQEQHRETPERVQRHQASCITIIHCHWLLSRSDVSDFGACEPR